MDYGILVLMVVLGLVLGGGVIGVTAYFLSRGSRKNTQWADTFAEKMQVSLDRLQQTLATGQTEFERLQELKATHLRTEIHNTLQHSQNVLEQKVQTMDSRLDKRLEGLTVGVQSKLEANLKEGFMHFTKVQDQLQKTHSQLQTLTAVGQSIEELNNLLKLPHLRGGFGEATLERMLADNLSVQQYELQYRVVPGSAERVDAVIKFPDTVLPIDSKFPREQVLPLFENKSPEELEQARKTLCDVMRVLGKQIKEKYIHPEHGTTEMALLFVPSETLYFEILRNPKLCDELGKFKVFAVSPNTLFVTLQAVTTARRYYEMARDVQSTLEEVRKAKQHFERFEKRYEDIGSALNKAQEVYHTASTHLSRYTGSVMRLVGDAEQQTSPLTSDKPGSTLLGNS